MMTEDEMVGWHPQHDGHEFEQALGIGDGQGGLECCRPWGRKESDMTEQLNWSENKKVLGTLGKRTILKAKEGLGVQCWGKWQSCRMGTPGLPWPEMVRFYWARQPARWETWRCLRHRNPRLGDASPAEREDGGSPSCGLGDGDTMLFKERQKNRLFLWVCGGKWGPSPTRWAWGTSVLIRLGNREEGLEASPSPRLSVLMTFPSTSLTQVCDQLLIPIPKNSFHLTDFLVVCNSG